MDLISFVLKDKSFKRGVYSNKSVLKNFKLLSDNHKQQRLSSPSNIFGSIFCKLLLQRSKHLNLLEYLKNPIGSLIWVAHKFNSSEFCKSRENIKFNKCFENKFVSTF